MQKPEESGNWHRFCIEKVWVAILDFLDYHKDWDKFDFKKFYGLSIMFKSYQICAPQIP